MELALKPDTVIHLHGIPVRLKEPVRVESATLEDKDFCEEEGIEAHIERQ